MEETMRDSEFKPFVVSGGRWGKNLFRVVQINGQAETQPTRADLEKFFGNLPMVFSVGIPGTDGWCVEVNESLDVYVSGLIIEMYPPKGRVSYRTNFDARAASDVVRQMKVDNVGDMQHLNGQVCSRVHVDPAVLGAVEWSTRINHKKVEIDYFVYPRTKREEPQVEPYRFGKFGVCNLLDIITGDDGHLKVQCLEECRDLILYAVATMRASYENPDTPKDYPIRVYYSGAWADIEKAAKANDPKKLVRALEALRSLIQWE